MMLCVVIVCPSMRIFRPDVFAGRTGREGEEVAERVALVNELLRELEAAGKSGCTGPGQALTWRWPPNTIGVLSSLGTLALPRADGLSPL